MRLIDADEAIERIEKEIESINAKIEEWERNRRDREGRYDVDARIKQYKRDIISCRSDISALRSYSTVDAEPVRHGKWERTDITEERGWALYRCPYCNWHTTYYYSFSASPTYNFCPNCGVKLDGE